MSRRPARQRHDSPATGRPVRNSPRHRRLAFEPLEVRRMLAVLAVSDILFAPRDVVTSTAVHDVDEGAEVVATSVASGEGTLHYDWQLTQGANVSHGNNPAFQFTPPDDANYSVTLTITDDTPSVASRTESLIVRNVRPVLVVAPNQIVGDGKLLDLTGIGAPPLALFIDDDILDTHTVTVDWGDGTALATPTMYSDGKGSVALGGSHTYANDGIYLVTVQVVDDDGGRDSQSFFVTMLTNDGPVDEGSSASVSFGGQFDPSMAEKLAGFRYAYDFDNDGHFDVGDGKYAGSVANPIQIVAATYLDGRDTRTVRARMINEYGEFAEGMTVITIKNVAPTAELANNGPVDEGGSASVSFSGQFDPSVADTLAGFRYAYDFDNDGTFDVGDDTYADAAINGTQMVPAAMHADGLDARTVRAWIIDQDGGHTEYTTVIDIKNVAPTLTLPNGNQTVDEGSELSITNVGTITDPGFQNLAFGTDETFTYSINWGDGTIVDNGTATIDDVGGVMDLTDASFDGSHTYADNGMYRVTVNVVDDNGGSDTEMFTVTVHNVNPVLTVVGSQTVDEGSLLSLPNIGTLTDPGFDNPLNPIPGGELVETFTYSIDWGDGTMVNTGPAAVDTPGSVGVPTAGSFDGSHIYTNNGTYIVTVTIRDDDGGSDFEMFPVTVKDVNLFFPMGGSDGSGPPYQPQPLATSNPNFTPLLPPPPLPSNRLVISDAGSGGGPPLDSSNGGPDPPDTLNDAERTLQELLSKARGTRRGEVIDAVYSLADVELVSLLGIDMGDEPVSQKRQVAKKQVLESDRHEPAPALPSDPVVAADEPGRRTLAFWSALAGSTLSIGGGLWWFGWKRRRNTHRRYASSIQ